MIYLDNITSGQTVYIPRNESGANPHKSNSYWEGFEDGYESGETHQKNLLSSVTFTENGEYERENGWSAVTVDVPQTGSTARLEEKTVVISADTTNVTPSSGYDGMSAVTVDASSYAQQNYDNGFDDGFVDGYASGSTDEKAKLSAVTFTTNTAVTISDGGYSAITVNVPQTGSSLNVEANKSYTANTNGTYTITPSSFQLVVNEGIKRITFDASQYPNEGEYDLGRIYDSSRDYYIEVEFWNGEIDYDDTNWPSGGNYRKYVYRTGDTKMQIEFENLSFEDEDVEWVGDETGYTYDVMSAVTLNVNVKQQFGYIEIIDPDANLCYFELGNVTPDLHSKIVLHNVTFSADPGLGYNWRTFLTMCRVERGRICSDMSQVVFDGRTEGRYGITAITDTDITLEYDKVTIGDDVYNYAINETQYEAMTDYNNMVLFNFIKDPSTAGTSTSQARYAKVGEIEIYDSANTLTYDYIPTVDENGIICFYERINDFYVYSSNGNNDYLSANTVNLGKGSFSANGTYSASTYGFDGYSEVTINVPQTGGSANLGSKTGTTNGTYNASTDNLDGYSAFTINVDTASTWESGYTSGETHQKSLLTTTAFTQNGSYQRENGWSGVTVNIDTASTYNSGYTSGYTDGQNNIIDTFSAMTATTNGQYGSSAHPLSAITVDVPQTGSSIPLSSITFTANTSVTVTDKAFTAITVNVPQTGANITDTIVYVTANTQAVSASHYNIDGFGNVLIRAEYWWQSGYTSGFTDGTGALSAITFTANTAVTLNQGGYSAVTVNVDTATTWNDGYAAGQGELFCLYCENALFNIGESSSEAEFDDVYINLLTLSGFNITVGGGGRGGQLVATDSGNTVGFVGYWQTSGNTYTTPVTSIAKGTIPTGMVSVGITDYGPINFYVDGTTAASSGGVKIPTGSYSLSFSGDSFYLGSIRRNGYYNCFAPYVDDNGKACMIGPNRTLVYPTSGTCYAVYKKVTKNGEHVYYMSKEVGRVTQ